MWAAALCWVGFAAVAALVVAGRSGGFDEAGATIWRTAEVVSPGVTVAVRDISALGGAVVRNLIAIAVMTVLLFLRLRREAAFLVFTVVTGTAAAALLKLAFDRPRPDFLPHLVEVSDTSFPSGHSFNAAVTYIAIAVALSALARTRGARTTLILGALAISLAVAWSRVWLGVHYPTDVIAGWLGGAGWALLLTGLIRRPLNR